MLKVKWYLCKIPGSFEQLVTGVASTNFSDELGKGFETFNIYSDTIECRFIQRVEKEEKNTDPFGNTTVTTITRYVSFDFSISNIGNGRCIIKVEFPPASIRAFAEALYDVVGFGVTLTPIKLDLLSLTSFISAMKDVHQLRVSSVKASGLKVGSHSSARVEVESKLDALADVTRLYGESEMLLDKIKLSFRLNDQSGRLEASKGGLICMDDDLYDELKGSLDSHLISASSCF
ncbi:hypothetical protein KUV56_08850 [Ferrimonas balearica]|uniref:hypothetical protein n=1 Tax=Ferrimonas balearica TaxID=44012 RepID=UPI001C55BC7F|nr:hypothetical protein [Ferrimonas balearica]MBW3139623.1 hypothetical protein [Ferrimonas balearica]